MAKKSKKEDFEVDLILLSDVHLRMDVPICRTDDFHEAQFDKIAQVRELQELHNCPVICAGDIFHNWKAPPELLTRAINELPDNMYAVYGQHDLPAHDFEAREKSGMATLEAAGAITILDGGNWKQDPLGIPGFPDVGVLHRFVWDGKKIPWPDCDELTAAEVLKLYPQFRLIVTGDHHKSFVHRLKDGRVLVNPGCFTRQDASYKKHKPRVYLYCEHTGEVKPHFLKVHKSSVVSNAHLIKKKEQSDRLSAFVESISVSTNKTGFVLSFEDNLDRFFKKNKTKKGIKTIIYKAIES